MADYSQMLQLVADYYGAGSDQWLKVAGGKGATADELLTILKQTPGVNVITSQDGAYRGWVLSNTGSTNIGTSIGSAVDSNIIGGTNSIANTGNTFMPPDMVADSSTGLITVKNASKTASGKWITSGGVAPAIAVAATGLSLGVTIDKALYAAKPGFLTDEQLETLNPDNWKQISNIVDEQWTEMGYPTVGKIGRAVFDTILGIDSTDSSTQMYVDEDAFTYAAQYLQTKGMFAKPGYSYPTYTEGETTSFVGSDYNTVKNVIASYGVDTKPFDSIIEHYNIDLTNKFFEIFCYLMYYKGKPNASSYYTIRIYDKIENDLPITLSDSSSTGIPGTPTVLAYPYLIPYNGSGSNYEITPNGGTFDNPTFSNNRFGDSGSFDVYLTPGAISVVGPVFTGMTAGMSNYGSIIKGQTVPGTGTQQGATLPDFSTATDFESFKTLLKQQYPDVWTNSVTKNVIQPDGTLKTFTYVPVPTPNATDWMDTEPTGDGSQQSQKDTVVNPDMDDSIKDTISSSGSTGTTTPNPPDTGEGDSPTVVPPVGKASSLWSIYNPTLEQVNQFGSWLWSSDFVEQLKKLFSDPMQAIIGLHKVYSPVQTSGVGTIKCGYLDSAVPSKLVSEQYTTVDCGSVDLQEYFGNVFDYPPYTEVSIYLPFIGIRQLDTSDVMRSTISVKYHIDVLTGACLAEVNVQRDAAGGTLYTFSGDAAVRYPVSSGSYMGIVSGLIGVATSVVSGNLLPALGGVTRLHTNVDRSGSFTGNTGAMGSKIPYLIISRPQTAMADKFETLSGYPSNTYTTLSACKGFTQVKYCHVENLNATDAEKKEIERLLKEGVIL